MATRNETKEEAESDPLSGVPSATPSPSNISSLSSALSSSPAPGRRLRDLLSPSASSSSSSSRRNKNPPSTSSSSSRESSTDEGESCESKFCKRVNELIKSSEIGETNTIDTMKKSYTNLERAIKQNLDKDESQSKGIGKKSDDDLFNLSFALRAKRKKKETEDSKKTKEVKELTQQFKDAVEEVIKELQEEKKMARKEEEEEARGESSRERGGEGEIEMVDMGRGGGEKSRKKESEEIEKFIKYLSTFVKEDLKQIINGKHHEVHRRKHMEKLKSTDNGKNNGGVTDSMLKALVKAIGKDSDGAKEARKHLQMLLKEYPDKVPTALIKIVRDKLKTKGLGIILAIQLSATIIGLLISIIPIPGLALIGESVAIAANMGTDVITFFGPLNIIDLLKNGSKEALETFTKSMVPVINSLSGAWCCNKSDGTENKSVKLFLNGLAKVSEILYSKTVEDKKTEIDKVIDQLQSEIESGSPQEKSKTKKQKKRGDASTVQKNGGGKRRKTRKKRKRKRKKRKTRRRRKKKKRKTNKYRKRFTRRY